MDNAQAAMNGGSAGTRRVLGRALRGLTGEGQRGTPLLLLIVAAGALLLYCNLDVNPRPWGDEGSYLTLAKTLVQDGVYAVRTSDGYQTFGAVQSLGPTIVLPLALGFKVFGIGLLQGRLVTATLALLTLMVFYMCGVRLFGRRAALFATIILVASPAVGFLRAGRGSLGEVPALGLFLAGWVAWSAGLRRRRSWLFLVAGLLVGAAMVTKSHWVIIGFAAMVLVAVLGRAYFRDVRAGSLLAVASVALACVAAWWLWQRVYYGPAVFAENMARMRELSSIAVGFHVANTISAVHRAVENRFIWGIGALVYGGLLCLPRARRSWELAFLWIVGCLWLGYYTFWIIPWPRYLLPAAAISALFAGKLCSDLLASLLVLRARTWQALREFVAGRGVLSAEAAVTAAGALALLTFGLLVGYDLQQTLRRDVLSRSADEGWAVRDVAAYLGQHVDKDLVIYTWERELSVLTDHRYHFPDHALLVRADARKIRGAPNDYAVGREELKRARAAYVVVGWLSRVNEAYDTTVLTSHGRRVATIGSYEVFKLAF